MIAIFDKNNNMSNTVYRRAPVVEVLAKMSNALQKDAVIAFATPVVPSFVPLMAPLNRPWYI